MIVGAAEVELRPDGDGFARHAEAEIRGSSSRLANAFGGVAKAAAGVFAATFVVGKAVDFLGGLISDAQEATRVGRITNQVIQATGQAANVTGDEVAALAERLSNKTAVDDELIQSGANVILTFKNIRNEAGAGNDVFNRATQAALDLSAVGFGSVESASVMLGKALNDPLQGITALSRAGVTFTAQQKEQIKALVESGDVLSAQRIILDEVASQVGGAAQASADPIDRLRVIFGNLREEVGARFLPTAGKAADFISDRAVPAVLDWASSLDDRYGPALRATTDFLAQHYQTAREFLTPLEEAFEEVWDAAEQLWTSFQEAGGAVDIASLALRNAGTTAVFLLENGAPVVRLLADLVEGFSNLPAPVQAAIAATIAYTALRPQLAGMADTLAGPLVGSLRGFNDQVAVQRQLARQAGEDVGYLGGALATMQANTGGARGVLSGLLGVVGGPWGLAFAGAGVALSMFAKDQAEAEAYARRLRGSLDDVTGALTDLTRETVVQQLEQEGALDLADKFGLSLETFTSAALGEADARRQVTEGIREYVDANSRALTANGEAIDGYYGAAQANNAVAIEAQRLNDIINGSTDELATQREAWLRDKLAKGESVGTTRELAEAMGVYADTASDADQRTRALKDAMDVLNGGELNLTTAKANLNEALDRMLSSARNADGSIRDLSGAVLDASGSVNIATEEGRAFHDQLQAVTARGLEAASAAHETARSNGDLAGATAAARQETQNARDQFIAVAGQMGITGEEAAALADRYGLIPDRVETVVSANVAQAEAALDRVAQRLMNLPRERVTTVRINEITARGGNTGGGFAKGGRIPGPASDVDNTWTRTATGEFVVNADATSRNLRLLEAINAGQLLTPLSPLAAAVAPSDPGHRVVYQRPIHVAAVYPADLADFQRQMDDQARQDQLGVPT